MVAEYWIHRPYGLCRLFSSYTYAHRRGYQAFDLVITSIATSVAARRDRKHDNGRPTHSAGFGKSIPSSLSLLPLEIQHSALLVHPRTPPSDVEHDRILEHDEQASTNQAAAPLLLQQATARAKSSWTRKRPHSQSTEQAPAATVPETAASDIVHAEGRARRSTSPDSSAMVGNARAPRTVSATVVVEKDRRRSFCCGCACACACTPAG